jgi:hypothetical protein
MIELKIEKHTSNLIIQKKNLKNNPPSFDVIEEN